MKSGRIIVCSILFASLLTLPNPLHAAVSDKCAARDEVVEVRGASLAPLINPGEEVHLLYGYYDCHDVKRGDVVAYKYAGNGAPIIKVVKAVAGDNWRLKKDKKSWMIEVNAKTVLNSEGEAYRIPESNARMLKLYVKSYPVLPENTYLILGNMTAGSMDSTRFGLIHRRDILGKIERASGAD